MHLGGVLPEEVRAGADRPALVRLFQQLGGVARRLVHERVARFGREDARPLESAHDAVQRRPFCRAVGDGLLVDDERLAHAALYNLHIYMNGISCNAQKLAHAAIFSMSTSGSTLGGGMYLVHVMMVCSRSAHPASIGRLSKQIWTVDANQNYILPLVLNELRLKLCRWHFMKCSKSLKY